MPSPRQKSPSRGVPNTPFTDDQADTLEHPRRTTRSRVKTKRFSAEENQSGDQSEKRKRLRSETHNAVLEKEASSEDPANGDKGEFVVEEVEEKKDKEPGGAIVLNGVNYKRWQTLKSEANLTDDDELLVLLLADWKHVSEPRPGGGQCTATGKDNAPTSSQATSDRCKATVDEGGRRKISKDAKKSVSIQKSRRGASKSTSSGQVSDKTKKPVGNKVQKVEEDPSERILKRKRIGLYDCRKTPTGGIIHPGGGPAVDGNRGGGVKTFAHEGAKLGKAGKSRWCRNCDCKHDGDAPDTCPLSRPDVVVTDSVIDFSTKCTETSSSDTPDVNVDLSKSFAQLSLPSPLLLQERDPCHGLSVVARADISAFTQFGPLQGEAILERDVPEEFRMKDLWQIFTADHQRLYVSTVNPEKSNWLRYLRPAASRKLRNVAAVVTDNTKQGVTVGGHALHFITTKDLASGDELAYWIDDPDLMWTRKRAEKKNCGGCNLRFSHPLYYRLHCTVFHDPQFSLTIRKYHCKVCGLAVLGKDNIVKHAQAEHGGKGAYQCQFCKKYFLRLNYLDMHRTYGCSANPDRTRPKCQVCGKKFCQPQKLKIHMKRMHNDSVSLEPADDRRCPVCAKVLGSKNALQRHHREAHFDLASESNGCWVSSVGSGNISSGGGQPAAAASSQQTSSGDVASARVACEKCGWTFKNKSNLKIHMLTHSGVKPFGCKIEGCKTGFTTKQCLQFHYRKAHGLTEEEMPKIEREIPYTLTAYSGGGLLQSSVTTEEEADIVKPTKSLNCTSTATVKEMGGGDLVTPSPAHQKEKADEEREEDVYHFEDDVDSKKDSTDELRCIVQQRRRANKQPLSPVEADGINRASMLVVAALAAAEQDIMKTGTTGRSQAHEDEGSLESPKSLLQDRQISSAGNDSTLSTRDVGEYSSPYGVTSSAALSHSAQSLLSGPTSTQPGVTKEYYRIPGPSEAAPSSYELIASSTYNLYPGFEIAPGRPCATTTSSSYYAPYPRHSDYLEDSCTSPYRPSLMDAPSSPFPLDASRHHHYRSFQPTPLHSKDHHNPPDPRLLHAYGHESYPNHHGYHSSPSSSYPPQTISPPRMHASHYHGHPTATSGRLQPPPANPYHPYGYF